MARSSVSKRPIWLVEAACFVTAWPPTIQRMAGSRPRRSASFTSSYPPRRPKNRLTDLPDHAKPPVLAGTAVLEKTPGNLSQAKGIVKLPVGEKSSVGSDLGTVELKLQSTVEIGP